MRRAARRRSPSLSPSTTASRTSPAWRTSPSLPLRPPGSASSTMGRAARRATRTTAQSRRCSSSAGRTCSSSPRARPSPAAAPLSPAPARTRLSAAVAPAAPPSCATPAASAHRCARQMHWHADNVNTPICHMNVLPNRFMGAAPLRTHHACRGLRVPCQVRRLLLKCFRLSWSGGSTADVVLCPM